MVVEWERFWVLIRDLAFGEPEYLNLEDNLGERSKDTWIKNGALDVIDSAEVNRLKDVYYFLLTNMSNFKSPNFKDVVEVVIGKVVFLFICSPSIIKSCRPTGHRSRNDLFFNGSEVIAWSNSSRVNLICIVLIVYLIVIAQRESKLYCCSEDLTSLCLRLVDI